MSESGTDPVPGVPERFLEAVVSVGSELELGEVLRRVVTAAADLVDAQYGALGVIGEDQTLSEFITVGITDAQRRHIGRRLVDKGVKAGGVRRSRRRRALGLGRSSQR